MLLKQYFQATPAAVAALALTLLLSQACKNAGNSKQQTTSTEIPTPPASEEHIMRYDDGQVSERVMLINGKKEGKLTNYYPDGKLKAELWFENDRQVGRTVMYYPTGKIQEVQYYQDGKKEGGDTIFYENGRAQFAVLFHQGKMNGTLTRWDEKGKKINEFGYSMDTLVSVQGKPVTPAPLSVDTKVLDKQREEAKKQQNVQ